MIILSVDKFVFITFLQGVVHPKQIDVAKELIERIKRSQPDVFEGIKYFDFFTIVPYFKSLGVSCFTFHQVCRSTSTSHSKLVPLIGLFFQANKPLTVSNPS